MDEIYLSAEDNAYSTEIEDYGNILPPVHERRRKDVHKVFKKDLDALKDLFSKDNVETKFTKET